LNTLIGFHEIIAMKEFRMPFTFSHPIFAWPLKRLSPKQLSATGLVLGSMAPDFEYFLMLEPYRSIGHTLPGLFMQAMPLSVLFAVVFHGLIKRPLARHLPSVCRLDARACSLIGEWRLRSVRDWIVFLASVTIGFITHVAVDGLTHARGYFVSRLPVLQQAVLPHLPLYKLLQYGLSLLGLAVIFGYILWRLGRCEPAPTFRSGVTSKHKIGFWLITLAVSAVVIAVKLLVSGVSIGILVVAPITGSFLGLMLAAVAARYWMVSGPQGK
jgi:hypothetical protein